MAIELTEEQKKQGYKVVKLGDICSTVASGGTPSRKVAEYYSDELGIPWVKTQEIRNNRISSTGEFISQLGLENSSAKIFPQGTILIAMYGATVGRIGWLTRPMATNQAACALVVDTEKATAKYIYYALFQRRSDLINLAIGAAQQNLNLTTIKNFEIALPPLSKQKRIANILGSLDEKIEANNSIIQTISDLVVAEVEKLDLFDKDSDATLKDIIEFSPKVSKPSTNDFQFIDMSALPTQGAVTTEILRKEKWSGSKFEEGDTLLARITPCLENGKTAIAMGLNGEPAVGSTEFIVMRPRVKDQELLVYGIARSQKFREIAIQKMTGTSGRQRVRWQDLSSTFIDSKNLDKYRSIDGTYNLLRLLRKENFILDNLVSKIIKLNIK